MLRGKPARVVMVAVVAVLAIATAGWLVEGQMTHPGAQAEPQAPAAPQVGTGGDVRVVGLGDSVAAGSNCDCENYVAEVANAIAAGRAVDVKDLAIPGGTTEDLHLQVANSVVREDIAQSDLVLITVGANDLDLGSEKMTSDECSTDLRGCYAEDLSVIRSNVADVVTTARALQRPGGRVVVTGYWNVSADGEVADEYFDDDYRAQSRLLTIATNEALKAACVDSGGLYVDLTEPFLGQDLKDDPTRLLTPDGDHPSQAGHERITTAVLQRLAQS